MGSHGAYRCGPSPATRERPAGTRSCAPQHRDNALNKTGIGTTFNAYTVASLELDLDQTRWPLSLASPRLLLDIRGRRFLRDRDRCKCQGGAPLASDLLSVMSPFASICRRQPNSWLALIPRWRAICDTEFPGRHASATSRSFLVAPSSPPLRTGDHLRPFITLPPRRTHMNMHRR